MGKQLLDGQRGTLFYMDPDKLTVVTDQSSPYYDPRVRLPVDDALVNSAITVGIYEPVIVTVLEQGKERIAIVVDGKQRVRAAQAAKELLRKQGNTKRANTIVVPVIGEKKMDDALVDTLRVTLNELRQETPPLMRAEEASRMVARGSPLAAVAELFQVKPQTIQAWIKVHKASASVRKAVQQGAITMTQAENVVAGQTDEEQEKLLEAVLAEATNGGRTMPVSKIKAVKKARKKNQDIQLAPSRRVLRKLVEDEQAQEDLPGEFIRGARWAAGMLAATHVKGLTDHLKRLSVRKSES